MSCSFDLKELQIRLFSVILSCQSFDNCINKQCQRHLEDEEEEWASLTGDCCDSAEPGVLSSYFQVSSTRMFLQVCLYFYCKCLWRCLKFMVRKLTGRCELQRICYSTKPGAARTMKIGKWLQYNI